MAKESQPVNVQVDLTKVFSDFELVMARHALVTYRKVLDRAMKAELDAQVKGLRQAKIADLDKLIGRF